MGRKQNMKRSGEMMACVTKSKPYTGIITLNSALSAPQNGAAERRREWIQPRGTQKVKNQRFGADAGIQDNLCFSMIAESINHNSKHGGYKTMKALYTKANAAATNCMMSGDYKNAQIWLDLCSAVLSALQNGEDENSLHVKYLIKYAASLENGVIL